jgi:hypothetical protein
MTSSLHFIKAANQSSLEFALTEMQYTVVRIFQKYSRLENRMSGPAKYRADIVLQPADGVEMAFFESEKA